MSKLINNNLILNKLESESLIESMLTPDVKSTEKMKAFLDDFDTSNIEIVDNNTVMLEIPDLNNTFINITIKETYNGDKTAFKPNSLNIKGINIEYVNITSPLFDANDKYNYEKEQNVWTSYNMGSVA